MVSGRGPGRIIDKVVNSEAKNVAGLAALGTTWLDIGFAASVRAIWHMLFWIRFVC
jgi:hypothetical protein